MMALIIRPLVCAIVSGFSCLLILQSLGRHLPAWISPEEAEFPLPHHVPKYPGNVSLRFAMVHDVIHERFPTHGPEYYKARNREARQALEKLQPKPKGEQADQYFRLQDDLGVGLEFLGEHQAAVDLMCDKLKRQEQLGYAGRDLYTSYANLGTFLVLWQLSQGFDNVQAAKDRITESTQCIHKAIDVYSESHFGRESWQVVLEEFLLAVLDKPELLLRYDMLGDRLDSAEHFMLPRGAFDHTRWYWGKDLGYAGQAMPFLDDPDREKTMDDSLREHCRACISKVGADEGWASDCKTSLQKQVPFDEPALGIVGMWRMGAGANPHFALALGEIMARVGQWHIAWTAYERAYQMREHFWADAKTRERFAQHCRTRQRQIEELEPSEDWDKVRQTFENELAFGQNYQKEYQEYESRRLADGSRTDDPHFYDAFDAGHEPIATPVGTEETVVVRLHGKDNGYMSYAVLVAGLFGFAAAYGPWRHGPKERKMGRGTV